MKNNAVNSILSLLIFFLSLGTASGDSKFDTYGGWKGLSGEKTGWFHTEKINDRWWIIMPEGNVLTSRTHMHP